MPRSSRSCPGGLVYHVWNRAAGRLRLFMNAGDTKRVTSPLVHPAVLEEAEEAAAAGIEDAAGEGTSLCKDGVGCFVAGTEVVTAANADGTFSETPIQDVYVGEDVMSRDQFDPSAPAEEQVVTAVEQHTVYSTQVVTLRASNGSTESITATAAHPFYVEGEGFTPAGDLTAAEEVEDESGGYATVVSSVEQADPSGVTVYNFTVANDHTYFVDQGGDAVWVHNNYDPGLGEFIARLKSEAPGEFLGQNIKLGAAGNIEAEIDVMTNNYLIEFKSGTGNVENTVQQALNARNVVNAQTYAETIGREYLVFGENLDPDVVEALQAVQINVVTSFEALLPMLSP